MNELRESYFRGLRARHAADIESFRRVPAGWRRGVLHAMRKRHAAVESETARILSAIELREGGSYGQAKN
jgi:hypothetical protein